MSESQFIQNALFLLLANSVTTGKCFHPDREYDLEGMKADAQFYHLWVFVEMNSALPQLVQGPVNLSPFAVLLREQMQTRSFLDQFLPLPFL